MTRIRKYENNGRIELSITKECRGLPPVEPSCTGIPLRASLSTRSQNDLNKPEYEALNTGETVITASACSTSAIISDNCSDRLNVTSESAISVATSRNSK